MSFQIPNFDNLLDLAIDQLPFEFPPTVRLDPKALLKDPLGELERRGLELLSDLEQQALSELDVPEVVITAIEWLR